VKTKNYPYSDKYCPHFKYGECEGTYKEYLKCEYLEQVKKWKETYE